MSTLPRVHLHAENPRAFLLISTLCLAVCQSYRAKARNGREGEREAGKEGGREGERVKEREGEKKRGREDNLCLLSSAHK